MSYRIEDHKGENKTYLTRIKKEKNKAVNEDKDPARSIKSFIFDFVLGGDNLGCLLFFVYCPEHKQYIKWQQ